MPSPRAATVGASTDSDSAEAQKDVASQSAVPNGAASLFSWAEKARKAVAKEVAKYDILPQAEVSAREVTVKEPNGEDLERGGDSSSSTAGLLGDKWNVWAKEAAKHVRAQLADAHDSASQGLAQASEKAKSMDLNLGE